MYAYCVRNILQAKKKSCKVKIFNFFNPKKAGLFESGLFLYSYTIIHFPRRTNLILVILYTIVQQTI